MIARGTQFLEFQPSGNMINIMRRSMVAMEPERASGNNGEKIDKLKTSTSFLNPDEIMKGVAAVGDVSKWEESYKEKSSSRSTSFEELDDANFPDVDVAAIVDEVEEALDAAIDSSKDKMKASVVDGKASTVGGVLEVIGTNALELDGAKKTSKEGSKASLEDSVGETNDPVAKHNVLFRVMNRALSPILGREIKRNVPKNTIKGAWISAALISMMGGLDPLSSAISATGISYVSITPGVAGDVIRAAGEATWDAGLIALRVSKKVSAAFGLTHGPARAAIVDNSADLVSRDSITVGHDIAKLVEEVEGTVAEVESVLESANEARDAAAEEEAQIAEAERLAEEARLAEIEYLLEEARIEKEAEEAEREYLAEIAEEERISEIARLEEEVRLKQEARVVEEELVLNEVHTVEEMDVADEYRLTELAQISELERLSKEDDLSEDGDSLIGDEDWEASIQLAEGLSADLDGQRIEWDAARQLAKDLVDEPEERPIDFNTPGLSEEERMELIGQAARAAVEKFEAEKQHEEEVEKLEKSRRNELKSVLGSLGDSNTRDTQSAQSSSSISSINNRDVNSEAEQVKYDNKTVAMLKDILRERGLKVSGRKAELIERLQIDDAQM